MKIEWLDDELTRARLVRGHWFWRREAFVTRAGFGWYFEPDIRCSSWLDGWLDERRNLERSRRELAVIWRKPVRLPVASLLERRP